MTIWALIIAIESYPNVASGLARILPGTNTAAEIFRNWAMTVKGVPQANIIACAEPACAWRTNGTTRPEIRDALAKLVPQARGNADELYVFFSGHGIGFAETSSLPPIDVLISSEFTEPSTSGPACILVSELKESLRGALGPGKHFYFIDACRNPLGRDAISPTGLGFVFGRSTRGNATTFVLFSTAPGDVASLNSGFNAALLRGLKGNGRAKEWLGGSMYVTFDRLTSFVQQALHKNDLEPEIRGPLAAQDSIVELDPTPTSTCTVEVIGAGSNEQFTLAAKDLRQGSRPPVTFVGPRGVAPFPPEDYLLQLTTTGGQRVPQIDPPPDPHGVDLYDDRKVQFEMPTPAIPLAIEPPAPENGTLRIFGVPGTDISLHENASGLTQTIQMTSGEFVTNLTPGDYQTQLLDGNFHLESARISVRPNARLDIDFSPKISSGAQASLAASIPNQDSLLNFSDTLTGVRDWNLSLWLAVLGAARILADPSTFSGLKALRLERFDNARPGLSVLYVLAGELDAYARPACDTGPDPTWRPMQAVPDLPGLFQTRLEFEPGPLLVTYGNDHDPTTTILVHGLPNRASLLTLARDQQNAQQIQQFILPLHSLLQHLTDPEQQYLRENMFLPVVRYMSTAQRLFALQSPIQGNGYEGSDRYWFDLLDSKWIDPVMTLVACYELIRRGAAQQLRGVIATVLRNMRQYFPGFADTEIIAKLLGGAVDRPGCAPLLMDGVLTLEDRGILPLPEAQLEFNSIWTSWRNALSLRQFGGDTQDTSTSGTAVVGR